MSNQSLSQSHLLFSHPSSLSLPPQALAVLIGISVGVCLRFCRQTASTSHWEPSMNPPLLYCTLYPCARACAPACPPPTPGYSGTLTQVRVRPFCFTVKYSKPKIAYWSWTCVYAATVLYVLCDAAVVAILHGSLPSQIGIGICLT